MTEHVGAPPLNGAGSEPYVLRPYKVLMADRYEPDWRFTVRIAAALGPADARNQARDLRPNGSPLREWIDEEAVA